MAFPKFLLERTSLSETAKIVYMILLNRARLSQKNDGWTDERGHIFIYYPIKDIAAAIHKSEMSVKTALSALEKDKLIDRQHQGVGKANRIFIKIPVERKPSVRQTENARIAERKTSVRRKENCPEVIKKRVIMNQKKEREKHTANIKMCFFRIVISLYYSRLFRPFWNTLNAYRSICILKENTMPIMPPRFGSGIWKIIPHHPNENTYARRMRVYELGQREYK